MSTPKGIDSLLADRPLTLRERIALRILIRMFLLVYPYEWEHKAKEFVEELNKDLLQSA
jgi:hypothetical protein